MKQIIKRAIHYSKKLLQKEVKHTVAFQGMDDVLNVLVAYNQYGGYCTPISSQHRPAVQQILKGEVYEPDTIVYMRSNCKEGDIIHAGTFFGDFLPGLSSALSPNAKIWAFEPNSENYRCAQMTILINDLQQVSLQNVGLGECYSEKKMLVETGDGVELGGASRIIEYQEEGKVIDIKTVSIDEEIPANRNIAIIQLDVEGYEKAALEGGMNTIKRCKPILILEDNNNIIETDWFRQHIITLGYEVVGHLHDNTVFVIK